uniref:Putative cyclin-d-binding myb-like transcription factor 1 n=1 Tax=Ornithodoros turicata TaxID=34597 RepID=A0A2R5L9U4_9ACAR
MMDLCDVAGVRSNSSQTDDLDKEDEEEDLPPLPCKDDLMIAGDSCLAASDVEEVVVVAESNDSSLSGMDDLECQGTQASHNETVLAPSYFLAPCTDESLPGTPCPGQTYVLSLQGAPCSLPEVPVTNSIQLVDALQGQPTSNPSVNIPSETSVNQNWFTSKEDKTTLQSKGHSWKQGMFSKEESEILENNIQIYCEEHGISNPATVIFTMTKEERKDFYRTIAKGLNRPLFSVYRRVIRMYDNKNHIGKYTSAELDKLKALRAAHGNDWRVIGNALGRSAASIKDRCRLMKENCRQGQWLPAEERRLAEAVYDLSGALPGEMVTSGLSWTAVADRVASRSEKQCRTKWLNYLNWKEAGGTHWTREDDITLISTVYALGVTEESMIDWVEFAKDWSSVRSPQWLRGKWWSLKRHVPSANKMSFRELCEHLYKDYAEKIKLSEEGLHGETSGTGKKSAIRLHPKVSTPSVQSNLRVIKSSTPVLPQPVITPPAVLPLTVPVTLPTRLPILEVIPQNIHLPVGPQAIILTTQGQGNGALATALPQGQILIQTLPSEPVHENKNVLVQMNLAPQVVMGTETQFLSSAQDTMMVPLVEHAGVGTSNSYGECCIDQDEFHNEEIHHHSSSIDEVDDSSIVSSQIDGKHAENVILADPMLAGSPELLESTSDIDSDRSHIVDSLDEVVSEEN